MPLVPEDATLMECGVIYESLKRIKHEVLSGTPSGIVIDRALEDSVRQAQKHHPPADRQFRFAE